MKLKAIIPHMTNNNTPSPFVASTSNQLATYAPFNAFQDNTGAWISDVANSWIQIDLGRLYEVQKVYIDSVNGWTQARVNTFTLQGSTDGVHWTTLYSGPTTKYSYTGERNFGTMRYVRCTTNSMTTRGGAIRLLQLYTYDESFIDFKLDDIWVTDDLVVLGGDVIIADRPIDVRVLINDVVGDDWVTHTETVYSVYTYEPSLFKQGGNVITVQVRTQDGQIKETQYVVYKLNVDAIKFNSMSYDFKIKNSPFNPKTDEWIGQSIPFDYLNSESGVSYMFKYKPYAQMDGRVEDRPRFFDKVITRNTHVPEKILTGLKVNTNRGIKAEDMFADVSKLLDAVKSRGFELAMNEARLMQQVFHAWGSINTERLGIGSDINVATKKMKIAHDAISKHKLPAHRENAIKNAFTIIQGFEHASKKSFDTVVAYYRAMDDIYPYKESILTGMLINGFKDRLKTGLIPESLHASIEDSYGYKLEHDRMSVMIENIAIVEEYINSDRIEEVQGGLKLDVLIGERTPENQVYQYSDVLWGGKDELYGTIENIIYVTKDDRKEAISIYDETKAIKEKGSGAHILSMTSARKDMKSKEFMIDGILQVEKTNSEGIIEMLREYIELTPVDATIKTNPYFSETVSIEALIKHLIIGVDAMPLEVRNTEGDTSYVNKLDKDVWNLDIDIIGVNKMPKDAWDIDVDNRFVDKLAKDFMSDQANTSNLPVTKHTNEIKEAWPIFIHHYFENMWRDVRPTISDTFANKLDKEVEDANAGVAFVDKLSRVVYNQDDLLRNVDKIKKEAILIVLLGNFNVLEKASIIRDNWEFAEKIIAKAKDMSDSAITAINLKRDAIQTELSVADKETFDAIITDQLLMDHTNLEAYIQDLIGAELNMEVIRDNNREALKQEIILTDREIARGIIQDAINANRINQEKEAYVPPDSFVLVGDGSEWEDIWDRYSPGVDILDPPDEDFNYSKMAPALYDLATGVPHRALGKTNKADVYIEAAMHHPLPENSTLGVDETKRIAVDNYIFIDTVLALESIKNRNKLRYAGMPVGKTIKEVFSSLFTWIQQGAPGHKEYERMFRFSRWYAEAVVLRQSKQILHRIYNPWQSTLHMGTGLGVDHTKPGWMYNTGSGTLNTTTLSAKLTFSKENYIDSEFVLRGYFDNAQGQGTMEIAVDGTVVESFQTHGVYERRLEIPQGHHTYDVTFVGTSGSAAISSIEVGGTIFVSAHTSTDDSDVNGLKALNELMAQLLGYFDLHHGGGKIKGTMEVRQRAVWNTHT